MPQDNFEICVRKNLLGISGGRNKKLQDYLQVGDRLAFYLTREAVDTSSAKVQALRGLAEVVGAAYMDDKAIWNPVNGEIFPYRVPLKFMDSKAQTPFRPLIPKLSFIENEFNWGLPMQKGYVRLTAEDWDVITTALGVKQQARR
jgi:predicted RNA-binding protein